MRPRDRARYAQLLTGLQRYERDFRPLPGIADVASQQCLLEQILESIHRVKYVSVLSERPISEHRADPSSTLFDPLKAAIFNQGRGRTDEACWLVFLFVHFGKHPRAGWRYAREVYGRLGQGGLWDWANVSANLDAFRMWLDHHQEALRRPGGFGNHRKYQSLDAYLAIGTGNAVHTYVDWIAPPRTHQEFFDNAIRRSGCDPKAAFDYLYHSMNAVASFGRMAKFDYLTMIGKLQLANIVPGSPYLQGATGPVAGANLLFGRASTSQLDQWVIDLDSVLQVGMQVLEDAICNWQKSPRHFRPFRG